MCPLNETTDVRTPAVRRPGLLGWLATFALLAVVALGVAGEVVIHRAVPILKGRVIETLSARFNGRVELGTFDMSLVRGIEVSGGGLRIFAPEEVAAAESSRPLLVVRQFRFRASLRGLFLKPTHVSTVTLTGLEIHIPPRQMREDAGVPQRRPGKMEILVDHFLCEDSEVVIDNADPSKESKRFALNRIELWRSGSGSPMRYEATLVNAIPRGDVHSTGTFGPWNTESPGDSLVTGHYTFEHADLDPIKGVGGMLSSVGDFNGRLNRIAVAGTTETPNFSLDSANQPMPLHTSFQAVVDGTTGDTYLTSVQARLRNTPIECKGSVVNIRGKGHVIDLDVVIANGNLQDLLGIAVKTRPVYLTAKVAMRAKVHIPPGKASVAQKLAANGTYTLREIRFTNPQMQDKVDQLSMRAQGRPAEAKPGAPDVRSQMNGVFNLAHGSLTFDKLDYKVPGAAVQLAGVYSLNGEQFDFRGKVRTDAELSQMASKWWQQILLKPVDHFFRKDGAGAEVPVRISGIHNEPKFGLDLHQDKQPGKPAFKPTINHQF